jgi:hypothetical protein
MSKASSSRALKKQLQVEARSRGVARNLRPAPDTSDGEHNASQVHVESERTLAAEVLQRRLPELQRLEPGELLSINARVIDCVVTTLGTVERLRPLLPALARLDGWNAGLVSGLEDWAIILRDAQVAVRSVGERVVPDSSLVAAARELRHRLHADALALTARRVLEPAALVTLKGRPGYKNLAHDLQVLHAVFATNQTLISGRSAVTAHDLNRARELAETISRAAMRPVQPTYKAARDLRARAYTMLRRAYAEARAGVAFLRRKEGDVDRIAPPLTTQRLRKTKKLVQAHADQSTAASKINQ